MGVGHLKGLWNENQSMTRYIFKKAKPLTFLRNPRVQILNACQISRTRCRDTAV